MPESGGGPGSSSPSWRLLLTELSRVVPKPVAQHLDSVLPQHRGRESDRAGSTIDLPRRADLVDLTGLRVFDLDSHLALCRQRTRERFFHVENRPGRNPKLLEAGQPVIARAFPEVSFDRPDQLGPRRLAQGVGREPGIVR